MQKGLENMAKRCDLATESFLRTLRELGGITEPQARKVAALYLKSRVLKLDAVNGRFNVSHGVLLDREMIRHYAEAD